MDEPLRTTQFSAFLNDRVRVRAEEQGDCTILHVGDYRHDARITLFSNQGPRSSATRRALRAAAAAFNAEMERAEDPAKVEPAEMTS